MRSSYDRPARPPAHGLQLPDGRPVETEGICGYHMNYGSCKFGDLCHSKSTHGWSVTKLKEKFRGSTTKDDRERR